MAYAKSTKALGICDRCGFTYKLNELKYEVQNETRNGLRVCHNCFDPDQPQFKVGRLNTADPMALFDPRTDSGEKASTQYYGFNPVNSTGNILRGKIGKVKIVIS
tara:strand:+ start:3463 stop:3777 length:315 start_codon:yes stop_codon:yes gene_type:complete